MLGDLPYTLLTIFQIGLVIFVHELGHYWAARYVGIRVDAFSIGFGPRLFGWKKGTCDWKFCLIPLGGYVKMAGEDPTRPTTGRDDEFGSKTVGQRVLVISAGVIMNLLFALITIPILFSIGVKFVSPTAGSIALGSAAWEAGLERGDRVLEVNGRKIMGFTDVAQDAAVGGEEVTLKVDRNGKIYNLTARPRDMGNGIPSLGMGRPVEAVALDEDDWNSSDLSPNAKELRQLLADAGASPGDRLLAVNGLAPEVWWAVGQSRSQRTDQPIRLTMGRDGAEPNVVTLAPNMKVAPGDDRKLVGVSTAFRIRSFDSSGGGPNPPSLSYGEELLAINGIAISNSEDFYFGLGGGDYLARFADDHVFANPAVDVMVHKDKVVSTRSFQLPTTADRRKFAKALILETARTPRLYSLGGALHEAGLRPGDLLMDGKGNLLSFDALLDLVEGAEGKTLTFDVQAVDGTQRQVQATPTTPKSNRALAGLVELGLFRFPEELQRVPVLESFEVGLLMTQRFITRIVQTLSSVITARVDSKHLGGIISIFTVSKLQSKRSLAQGFLFLAMVSINLAILNILPIPVLDGGWLMFLIIERIKGSPVGEKSMAIAQWIGLILIMALMLYVTFNDIRRLLGWI